MRRKTLLIVSIIGFIFYMLFVLPLINGDTDKSEFTSSNGYQHKEFGSSSSLDGKSLILTKPEMYVFEVSAKMQKGYLSVSLLDKTRSKEYLKIEGGDLKESKEIFLEAGEYVVEIQTYDAEHGQFTIKYGKK